MEASTPVKSLDQAGPPRATGALPNLIVIGAQKCGTSVLHYYLGLHPEVSMSKPKELNFFIEERNWPRGVDWYAATSTRTRRSAARPRRTTPPSRSTRASPSGWHWVVPDAKLIYMVRDPLERIAAHWVHNYAKRREKGTLAETLMPPEHLLRRPARCTRCSSSASSPTIRRSGCWSSSSPSFATSGWRRCARCSSSSASTRTSPTRASSRSATRPRARPARPGSR